MTKTFRPDLAEVDPPEPDELLDDDGDELLEEQAATARADATKSVEAANGARLSEARMARCPFVAWIGLVLAASAGWREWRPGGWQRANMAMFGTKTETSSRMPVTTPGRLLVEVGQQQRVLQPGEGQHREEHPDDRALAAEDRHPGQQHDRDHVE